MRKIVPILALCLANLLACNKEVQPPKVQQREQVSDIQVLASSLGYVGGMTWHAGKFYVASWDSPKAGAKQGQGKILELDSSGKILSGDFLPQVLLHAPKGLMVLNGRLYITDIDSVKVVDLASRQLVMAESLDFRSEVRSRLSRIHNGRLVVQGTELYPGLADIVAGRDGGVLFVAVTNSGNIYRVDTRSKRRRLLANTPYANSLCYHDGTLYANGFTLGNTSIKILQADSNARVEACAWQWHTQGGLDALCYWQANRLLFSDWGADYMHNGQVQRVGRILQLELSSGKVTALGYRGEPQKFAGPCAMLLVANKLYVLSFANGSLYRIALPPEGKP